MRMREACDSISIRALLDYLNVCHDGVIRRVSFIKDRSYSVEGDVSYPCMEAEAWEIGSLRCDVEMEMLLNSYLGASLTQVVLLYFEGVRTFRFVQEARDYAEILEVDFNQVAERVFEFVFRAGGEKEPIDVLTLVCENMLCVELDKPAV